MKKSEINFTIALDNENIPEQIHWHATDKDSPEASETKSVSISLWDHQQRNTLRMDLWSKDMPLLDMKRFYVDMLGGLAQSVLNATGDTVMSEEINATCERLSQHVKKEFAQG